MSRVAATRVDVLERVASAPSALEAMRAAAKVPRAAPGVVDAFDDGDALTRILLVPALPPAELLAILEGSDPSLREHAAWALAGRPVPAALPALHAMAHAGGFGGMIAELTLDSWHERRCPPATRRPGGLRIVQVFMQGWLDAGLTRPGAGDGGGLATLLVGLSAALAARPDVAEVVTLTRRLPGGYEAAREDVAPGAAIERIAFGGAGYLGTAEMWPHRRELERGLEVALRRLAPDAVHLRFADVATLAAARVCERLRIPYHFTLAPDPHALIRRLDRDAFATADRSEHLLFRARLVERMRDGAAGLALLPRAGGLEPLLGPLPANRTRTVPEGIATATIDAAAREVRRRSPAMTALATELGSRPLILSVGRLHRVKGFPRLVEAWAGDRELRETFDLAIVGGDLERPTAEERAVLDAIARAAATHPEAHPRLLGHRSHADVARLMALARGSIYACASDKEEFGMALLEAMASGLSVVAPLAGGPSTYVDDGVNGVLVDTTSVAALREGLHRAAAARLDSRRGAAAAALVRERFTLDAMAAGLVELYRPRELRRAS